MKRSLFIVLLVLAAAGSALALQASGRLGKLDVEHRTLRITVNGQDHTAQIAADVRILDRAGNALPGGLSSSELTEGAEITVNVEWQNGQPVVQVIRLGSVAAPAAAPHRDTGRLKPLTEMGQALYQGFAGGLYPEGRNARPASHEAAGVALSRQIHPLDAQGRPAPGGKTVLLTVGMSNTTQASQAFKRLADGDPEKSPALVIVDGAQGAMTAARIQDPEDRGSGTRYWSTVDDRLQAAGVTRAQVQAVWIKEADAGPNQGFPAYARTLEEELARIVQVLPQRFPNVKLVYLSSRTYGGYATTPLNPEPYAYESGFSIRWLIERQLKGEPALNFNPAKGAVKAPWLSWGPYLWANGTTRRADGLSYDASDFAGDGTHESPSGQRKVGQQLLQFFKTDSTTKGWFRTTRPPPYRRKRIAPGNRSTLRPT